MNHLRLLLTALLLTVLATTCALAQIPTTECPNNPPDDDLIAGTTCDQYNTLTSGQFQATPLIDGSMQNYGDQDHNVVSLYGSYGDNEKTSTSGAAQAHYTQGATLANQITPLCPDGTTNCPDASKAIVFLFIGFSNTTIEVGGGSSDAWDGQDTHQAHLNGQPCSTLCENLNNPDWVPAWNQVTGDPTVQQSLLYQIYNPSTPLVGQHVAVFNGALGGQTLSKWDTTSIGYYAHNPNCPWDHLSSFDPECNYVRVNNDLTRNFYTLTDHYTEAQVQAVFIKTADNFPQCDLKMLYCSPGHTEPDAYTAERYLGDILRYLKCCKQGPYGNPTTLPRYANLKQVFVTSRIYGGYANGSAHGCLNPEPFAYQTVTKL